MQKPILSYKTTKESLKDRVKKILSLAGYDHIFSLADYEIFKMQTTGNFSQAFDIAEKFIQENQNTVNDYLNAYEI